MSSIEQSNNKWLYILLHKYTDYLKIGVTNNVDRRLKEANAKNEFKLHKPFIFLQAINLKEEAFKFEKYIKRIFNEYRIERSEFYKNNEEILKFFEILKGELWVDKYKKETKYNILNKYTILNKRIGNNKFLFRHIANGNIWNLIYDPQNITVMCSSNNKCYTGRNGSPFNELLTEHYKEVKSNRKTGNAWDECEIQINDNQWISLNKFLLIN